MLVSEAYSKIMEENKNDFNDVQDSLLEAWNLLQSAIDSYDYWYKDKKLFDEQLRAIKTLAIYTSVKSCLSNTVTWLTNYEKLLWQSRSILVQFQQFESKIFNFLNLVDNNFERECLYKIIDDNNSLQNQLRDIITTLESKYREKSNQLDEYQHDLTQCLDLTINIPQTKLLDDVLLTIKNSYNKNLWKDINELIQESCLTDDSPQLNMSEQLDKAKEELNQEDNFESQWGSSKERSNPDNDNKEWNNWVPEYEDVVPEQTQKYIEQVEERSEQYEKKLQELLEYEAITPEMFLNDQYKEFYGEDKDFREWSQDGQKLNDWER